MVRLGRWKHYVDIAYTCVSTDITKTQRLLKWLRHFRKHLPTHRYQRPPSYGPMLPRAAATDPLTDRRPSPAWDPYGHHAPEGATALSIQGPTSELGSIYASMRIVYPQRCSKLNQKRAEGKRWWAMAVARLRLNCGRGVVHYGWVII